MAETDPAGSSSNHVAIDVEEAAAEAADDEASAVTVSSSCAVCMEHMEWVAVSPCGHREVCVRCAARIRFVHNDRRRCICRTHCATVVVTKAPAAFVGQGLQVGVDYWYHRGMGAYFDDLSLYQEMSKVCTAADAADADAPCLESELERPLSRKDMAALVLLGVAGVLGAPLLYMISFVDMAALVLLGVAGGFILGAPASIAIYDTDL